MHATHKTTRAYNRKKVPVPHAVILAVDGSIEVSRLKLGRPMFPFAPGMFLAAVRALPCITHVRLQHDTVSVAEVTEAFAVLKTRSETIELEMCTMRRECKQMMALAVDLMAAGRVHIFRLRRTFAGAEFASLLRPEVLHANLIELDIASSDSFGDVGAEKLGLAMNGNRTLKFVHIESSFVKTAGRTALGWFARSCPNLAMCSVDGQSVLPVAAVAQPAPAKKVKQEK
jgi:hypothetical protein